MICFFLNVLFGYLLHVTLFFFSIYVWYVGLQPIRLTQWADLVPITLGLSPWADLVQASCWRPEQERREQDERDRQRRQRREQDEREDLEGRKGVH